MGLERIDTMSDIYVLGSINMDLVFKMNRLPIKGETMQGEGFMMNPGGKGANQAVASSLQGGRTFMVGSLGDDALSDILKEALTHYQVDTTHIKRVTDSSPGVAGIWLEGGDNRIVLEAGANSVHDLGRIEGILKAAPEDSVLIAQLEIPSDVVEHAFKTAKKKTMTTYLNAAPATTVSEELLRHTDVLVVNKTEAETLTGTTVTSMEHASIALKALLEKGVGAALLTLGARGAVYMSAAETQEVKGFDVEVLDTTGAGDAFIGAFAVKRAEGSSVTEALLHANAAGALSVSKVGAQKAIPNRAAVERFIRLKRSEKHV